MALLIKITRHRPLILLLVSSLAVGCASSRSLLGTAYVSIKKIPSENTKIGGVYVRKVDGGVTIGGTVTFRQTRITLPFSYMEVTILAPDGKVLYKAHSDYYRYGRPTKATDTFNFSSKIPLVPPKGSTVQLMHHT